MKSERGLEEQEKKSGGDEGTEISYLLAKTAIQGFTSLQCLSPRGRYMSWQKWLIRRKMAILHVCNKS